MTVNKSVTIDGGSQVARDLVTAANANHRNAVCHRHGHPAQSVPEQLRSCADNGGTFSPTAPRNSGDNTAANNRTSRTPQQCAGRALKKNAVALTLDVARVGAELFLPGGALAVAGAQATISVASGVNSTVHGGGIRSALGVLGLPATFTSYAAKVISVRGKAPPFEQTT